MRGLRQRAVRIAAGLAAAALAVFGLALVFSAWLGPGLVLDWLAVRALCS